MGKKKWQSPPRNGGAGGTPQVKKIEVDVTTLPVFGCAAEVEGGDCLGTKFVQVQELRLLSGLHPKNPTGETRLVPLLYWECVKCGQTYSPNEVTSSVPVEERKVEAVGE